MKIKRTLQPYVEDEKIVFGFGNATLVRTVPYTEDNAYLVKKLDKYDTDDTGKYTKEELKKVEQWRSMGLLTNNDYSDTRYSRNINFFEWIDVSRNLDPSTYQRQLEQKTVLIVGLGGIGGNVSEILTRLGVKKIILLDFDIVDISNLTRQSVFREKDIGRPKVDVVKAYLKEIDSNVEIKTLSKKILSKEDLAKIYEKYDFDLALCCADKPTVKIDYWFDDLSYQYDRPLIVGSYASTVINYASIRPGKTESLHKFYGENMITDDNLLKNEVPTSINSPISYMSAGLIAYRAFFELIELDNVMPDALQLDLLNWQVIQYDLSK